MKTLATTEKKPGVEAPGFCLSQLLTRYRLTLTDTVVFADVPPPDAVIVIVRVPVVALLDADTFMVVDPAADSELGVNVIVVPLPCPDAENVTAPVTDPASVIVELPDDPRVTVSEAGEAEIV
jgi:hypothetical protein